MNYITPAQYKDRMEDSNVLLLDVREPYEVEICAIGGFHLPMGEVTDRNGEIDKSKEVIVMCKSGKRAAAVANLLETDYSFPNVSILEGGVMAWIEQVDNSLEAY